MKVNYTKLKNGKWGVRVEGDVVAGQVVEVIKKDGSKKYENVVKILWSGNGVSLCAVAGRGKESTYREQERRYQR